MIDGFRIHLPSDSESSADVRVIPWAELTFRADTSGGPGGQHANRSATRVTLSWKPGASGAFNDEERRRILEHCSDRVHSDGTLRIRIASERSQAQNKRECLDVLRSLVRAALAPRKHRKATRPTQASVRRRLQQKKHRSQRKEQRKPPSEDS